MQGIQILVYDFIAEMNTIFWRRISVKLQIANALMLHLFHFYGFKLQNDVPVNIPHIPYWTDSRKGSRNYLGANITSWISSFKVWPGLKCICKRTHQGYLETNFPAQKRLENELNATLGENGAASFTVFPASTRISGQPASAFSFPLILPCEFPG